MKITLIAAVSEDGYIGRKNTIPWHLPEDLKRFKEATKGKAVIMGRKTWESLPRRPLPDRLNIVLSRQLALENAIVTQSIEDAVKVAKLHRHKEIFVIGGEEIYTLAMPLATTMILTEVECLVPDGDAKFPCWDRAEWKQTGDSIPIFKDSKIKAWTTYYERKTK